MADIGKIDAFVQSCPHPAWLATSRGECSYINPALEHLTGLKSDQINQVDWRSFVLEEDRAAASASWQSALASGTPYRTTVRLRGFDGVPVSVELIAFGHTLDDGTELWLFTGLLAHDTTQQYPPLDAQLQATLNVIPAHSWYALPSGALTFVNKRTADYLGLPKDDPLRFGIDTGAEWDAHIPLLHPDDRQESRRIWSACVSTGSPSESNIRVRNAEGGYRWFLTQVEPLRASDGTLLYWIGVNLDIDDRKRAEELARQSERELRTIVETIPAHIHSGRPDGYLDFFNSRWLEYVGLPLEDLLGWKWTAAIHPADVEGLVEAWRRVLATGQELAYEARVRRADGEFRWMFHHKVPQRDERGNIVKWFGSSIDIEEIKRTEARLKESEAYLSEAQRLSHTGSFGWNSDTGEIVWSDETYRIFEYDSTLKPTLDSIVQRAHPDDRALAQQVIDRASQTGTDFEQEYRLLLADGRIKHVHAIAHALHDASGNREFIGAVTDITEGKTAEEKIRRNETELLTLIEAIPAYVGTNLPDGSVDFISESWLDYAGFSREQGMGWGWASAIHPEDYDRVLGNWRAAVAAGAPVEHELRCRRADGSYHWFLFRSFPLRDDGGNVLKWYGTLTNIDALKEAEHALKMREHELLSIIETIPSMLWTTWPTGETTHLSQRVLEYCGAPLEELVNRGWEKFIHSDDRAETAKAFDRAISSGEPYSAIHRIRRADGEYRWHHSMAEPLRDPHGKIIQWYGLAIDIDERKRAEDHLRDTRIKLAKASRLATVAELAGSIAHELNQPLMSILANAQAAKRWLTAAPPNMKEVNTSIERIIRDARAADETMQRIRALFKQEPFDRKDVNIPNILREVVRVVQEDPKKRDVLITCRFEESLPMVPADQIQIQQVFINLIVNAIEALEGRRAAPLVVLRATTDSNGMLVQVIDNGPGVDDPDQIFDAFMTTKEKGMGIGLAVSRSIVEAHGGRLWAENNKTGGATFNVVLPLTHESHHASNSAMCLSRSMGT
jgi:PAS domain S-box-containing protein